MPIITNAMDVLLLKKIHTKYHALPFYTKIWLQLSSWNLSNALRRLDPDFTSQEDVLWLSNALSNSWFYTTAFDVLTDLDKLRNSLKNPQEKKSSPQTKLLASTPFVNPFLTTKDMANMQSIGNAFFEKYHLHRHGTKLLQHVVNGEVTHVTKLLGAYPELVRYRGRVTDNSGNEFTDITGFQYAMWALDTRYMCPAIIQAIPESNVQLKKVLEHQYLAFKGLTYRRPDGTIAPLLKHFDFKFIIDLLDTFIRTFNTMNAEEKTLYWVKTIGQAQRLFPAHIVYLFCTNISEMEFFSDAVQKNTRNIINRRGHSAFGFRDPAASWWAADLGTKSAFSRLGGYSYNLEREEEIIYGYAGLYSKAHPYLVNHDKVFLEKMWENRLEDFCTLHRQLRIAVDTVPSNSPGLHGV